MNNTVKKVLPVIFSIIGSVGVVATSVLAVKATPKAQEKLKEIEEESQKLDARPNKMLILKKVAPCYIPAIACGLVTILSISAGTIISKRTEASLSATCLALDQGYRRYKGKVKDVLGIDKHTDILKSIAKDDYEREKPAQDANGRKLYWCEYTGFFYARPADVLNAILNMNMRMTANNTYGIFPIGESGYCTLEQFVQDSNAELLNPQEFEKWSGFGWSLEYLLECWDENWIFHGTTEEKDNNGEVYTVITFLTAEPIYDPEGYDFYDSYNHKIESLQLVSDKLDSDEDVAMSK